MSLIFVDCEAYGGCPATGRLTEFGAVSYPERLTFHAILIDTTPDPANPAVPLPSRDVASTADVFARFDRWLAQVSKGRPVFVSDNVAFDWQWINDGFWRTLGRNPFGHSGRRISDFYAGLRGDFHKTQEWKRLRITPHDPQPGQRCDGEPRSLRAASERRAMKSLAEIEAVNELHALREENKALQDELTDIKKLLGMTGPTDVGDVADEVRYRVQRDKLV